MANGFVLEKMVDELLIELAIADASLEIIIGWNICCKSFFFFFAFLYFDKIRSGIMIVT